MSATHRVSRRRFLVQSAAVGGAVLGAPAVLRGQNLNSRVGLAVIGSGGRGGADLRGMTRANTGVDVESGRVA